MALITCPECGKQISSKADVCINCGYPLNKIENSKNTICNIDGKEYDLQNISELIYNGKYKDSFLKLRDTIGLSIKNCLNIIEFIDISETIPQHYEIKKYSKDDETEAYKKILSMKDDKTKSTTTKVCPKCGCTEFVPLRRKFSLLTGFATNKVDMVCSKCGTVVK